MVGAEQLKRAAGIRAAEYVTNGMRVGLGTGSTVRYTIEELGRRVDEEKLEIRCAPTSISTENLAIELGIPLFELAELNGLDIVIDGADEFDSNLNLIKGGGGALVREKIVAQASKSMIVVADESKRVETLGTFPLPVEVIRFSWEETRRRICELTGLSTSEVLLRRTSDADAVFNSDNGNHILDLHLGEISDPVELEQELLALAGVLDCGLFCGMASAIVLATSEGIEIIQREK